MKTKYIPTLLALALIAVGRMQADPCRRAGSDRRDHRY